ncbi:putative helicase-like protein, partial [Golovinomyces cichoracearum]
CEVVVRLDILSNQHRNDDPNSTAEDAEFFKQEPSKSVKWTLLLARTWLDNIDLEMVGSDELNLHAKNIEDASDNLLDRLVLHGRHKDRQVSGLMNFARDEIRPLTHAEIDPRTSKNF